MSNGVPYSGYEAAVIQSAITMVAASATLAGLVNLVVGVPPTNVRALRPTNAFLNSLAPAAVLRGYYPMERFYLIDGTLSACPSVPQAVGGAASIYAIPGSLSGGGAALVPVAGVIDGAMHGSRRVNEAGADGGAAYPSGAVFTVSRCAWFKEDVAGLSAFDLFYANLGGNQQFFLQVNSGGLIVSAGFSSTGGGHYLFPEQDGPSGFAKVVGAFPTDGLWHHIGFTFVNDPTGVQASVLTIFVDGVETGQFTGRTGAYFGSDNANRSYMGGLSGTANAQQCAASDLGIWDGDASGLFPTLALGAGGGGGGSGTTTVARIVESIGGVIADGAVAVDGSTFQTAAVAAFAVVHEGDFGRQQIGLNSYAYSGEVLVDLYLAMVAGDAPAEVLRRVRNSAGAICDDIAAQVGSPGCFARCTAAVKAHGVLDETTNLGRVGFTMATISITWGSP